MSVDPVGGPVVELGGRHPLPAVIAPYRRVLCRASCPGLRVLPVTPAGLVVELVELDPRPVEKPRTRNPQSHHVQGGGHPHPPTQQPSYLGAGPISPHDGLEGRLRELCRLVAHLAGDT